MSNEEEKRCPLCAEEMDWTDQQFMPCRCGYQICVWCWHHIIDMAEKEETEGRCPACRTIYEKEKIVAMQANSERTTTKSCNRKSKPPKAKPKATEVKKDLTNVRVIQRKMAYVIGLPLSLADEDLLLRKEYFGQYGKVTKVSLSRTAGGAIQQFVNDTCSVYITYSKEEEALRCIQSVHDFVLEGRLLRASFGTAKYCHAWLKNMPCNNPACLYLHSIGADEDSFGKDEAAAVHTRSRVQQIVGATNNVVKHGSVLPPPDDICNGTGSSTDKSTGTSGISEPAHSSANSAGDIACRPPSKEREASAAPRKMTTFVDIVGRSNSAAPERDVDIPEDRRISNLCSDLSSVAVSGDVHAREPYCFPPLFNISCSNSIGNGLSNSIPDLPFREDRLLSNDQGPKDNCVSSHRAFFLNPPYPTTVSEDSGGPALLHRKTHSLNGVTDDHNPLYNRQDKGSLPSRSGNSILNDSCQEMKFQNSAKSDRIYRSSRSFSNEEIVEHLRRIDDGNLANDEENSVLDAVESSIISNIMSIDFDSCEDSLTTPNGFSELLDETDGLGGSSWSSLNSDQSGYSFVKQDGLASQMAGSVLPGYGDSKEQYLCQPQPQYPVSRGQTLAPPGFSVPSRDPPPGFSSAERSGCLPRPLSGNRLANGSSFSSTMLQPPLARVNDADFFDPAILNSDKSIRTSGFRNPGFETRPNGTHRPSPYEDDSKFWLMQQQSASSTPHYSEYPQIFSTQTNPSSQQEASYMGYQMANGPSRLDNFCGLSSRMVDEHQNHDSSFFTQMAQQKYVNGHVSNMNGYRHSLDEVQHNKGEVGISEIQRNERLGVNYFPGYGDLMFSSADLYSRVFGL